MESESSEKKQRKRRKRREKEKLINKLIKERMAERVWARDRLFRGLKLDDLRSGDRRIFEDVEVAPTRQEFDLDASSCSMGWYLLARAPTHGG